MACSSMQLSTFREFHLILDHSHFSCPFLFPFFAREKKDFALKLKTTTADTVSKFLKESLSMTELPRLLR